MAKSKPNPDEFKKLFEDLAGKEQWLSNELLEEFRQKLKKAGESIGSFLEDLDAYIQEKIKDLEGGVNTKLTSVNSAMTAMKSASDSKTTSLGNSLEDALESIVDIKSDIRTINSNLNILMDNDENLAKAINDLHGKVNIRQIDGNG